MKLNENQKQILRHTLNTAANSLYCGDSEDMQGLVTAGLMVYVGTQPFCPDKYFGITSAGKKALAESE